MIYEVISTRCPIINKGFRAKTMNSSPDLEVLVRLEDSVPKGVICPEYASGRKCKLINEGSCIYTEGWKY
jgi:hypothetical protein